MDIPEDCSPVAAIKDITCRYAMNFGRRPEVIFMNTFFRLLLIDWIAEDISAGNKKTEHKIRRQLSIDDHIKVDGQQMIWTPMMDDIQGAVLIARPLKSPSPQP